MPDAAPRPLTAPDVVAGLLADVAEARAELAELSDRADILARELAAMTAERDEARKGRNKALDRLISQPQSLKDASRALNAMEAERDEARALIGTILREFSAHTGEIRVWAQEAGIDLDATFGDVLAGLPECGAPGCCDGDPF